MSVMLKARSVTSSFWRLDLARVVMGFYCRGNLNWRATNLFFSSCVQTGGLAMSFVKTVGLARSFVKTVGLAVTLVTTFCALAMALVVPGRVGLASGVTVIYGTVSNQCSA